MIHRINTISCEKNWETYSFIGNNHDAIDLVMTFSQITGWCRFGKIDSDMIGYRSWSENFKKNASWCSCWQGEI